MLISVILSFNYLALRDLGCKDNTVLPGWRQDVSLVILSFGISQKNMTTLHKHIVQRIPHVMQIMTTL